MHKKSTIKVDFFYFLAEQMLVASPPRPITALTISETHAGYAPAEINANLPDEQSLATTIITTIAITKLASAKITAEYVANLLKDLLFITFASHKNFKIPANAKIDAKINKSKITVAIDELASKSSKLKPEAVSVYEPEPIPTEYLMYGSAKNPIKQPANTIVKKLSKVFCELFFDFFAIFFPSINYIT